MLQKLIELFRKYKDVIKYLIFGVLTTAVNYIVYWQLLNVAHLSGTLSNVLAWAVAVAFAFLTNKPFVFESHDWSAKTVLPELWRFVASRAGSGLLETVMILVLVDLLSLNGNIIKIVTSILVIVLNYLTSKLLVFTKNKRKGRG